VIAEIFMLNGNLTSYIQGAHDKSGQKNFLKFFNFFSFKKKQLKKNKLYKVRWDYTGAFCSIFNLPDFAMVSNYDQNDSAARAIRDLIPDGHGLDEGSKKKKLTC
jgi:hypothetical protein